jgi:hypothetical protein
LKRYYRCPRTTQERRFNHRDLEYVRGRRHPCNLPNTYDDIRACVQKTWKLSRKTQYRQLKFNRYTHTIMYGEGRESCLGRWRRPWESEFRLWDYFNTHEIPFVEEPIKESYVYWAPWRNDWKVGHCQIGVKFTWWWHTEIGLEYIL